MPAPIHGNLGSVAPAAASLTLLYAAPTGRKATGTLTVCNRGASDATFRFAIIPTGGTGGLANKDYREYDTPISKAYEKTAIPMKADATLAVYASSADLSFSFDGIEEDA